MFLMLLWIKKREGQVQKGRTLVAKKQLNMDFTYGRLKVFFSKNKAEGQVLNICKESIFNRMPLKGTKH
jgi:hypothetical protein